MQSQPRRVHQYQSRDCSLTLRQGLDEYYAAHPEFNQDGDFLGQPRETVLAHDVCHVVFGLGATSEEELIVETLTFFGCRLPVQKIKEAKKTIFVVELLKTFGPWRLVKRAVLTTPRVLRALLMTRHMKKKWPHFDYAPYMNTPLRDIRKEFGIVANV